MTRRGAEVRLDALLRTACDVIVQRGLANTRTADVAQAAGVSQALVFVTEIHQLKPSQA